MQTPASLNDFTLILAIRNAGSLMGAARHLGIAHATAFRRLRALEKQLGAHLFERVAGRYSPTPAGVSMALAAERIESEAHSVLAQIGGAEARPAGEVTLACPEAFGSFLLLPLLRGFRERFADVIVHLVFANDPVGLNRHTADVAIRLADPPPHLIARKLGRIAYAPYIASARRASRRSAVLEELDWGVLDEAFLHHGTRKWLERLERRGRVAFRTNSLRGLCEAVQEGLGAAILPCFFGDARAGLTRLAPPIQELTTDVWILSHPDLRGVARIAVLSAYLAETLEAMQARLAGEAPRGEGTRKRGRRAA
ncbi:MAG TPA: LysR family transcriptional regulator [Burkholderiales bacterium]